MVKPLYEKNGWLTGTFDNEGFLIDQARALADIKILEFFQSREAQIRTG